MKGLLVLISALICASAMANTVEVSCYDNDCLHNGWTAVENGSWLEEVSCRDHDCRVNGWQSTKSNGIVSTIACAAGGCFVNGWTEVDNWGRFLSQSTCNGGSEVENCLVNGWMARDYNGYLLNYVCREGNCSNNGWDIIRGDGWRLAGIQCRGGDCFKNGWIEVY